MRLSSVLITVCGLGAVTATEALPRASAFAAPVDYSQFSGTWTGTEVTEQKGKCSIGGGQERLRPVEFDLSVGNAGHRSGAITKSRASA